MEELLFAWWRLKRLPGVGNMTLNQLREQLSSPDELLHCRADTLMTLGLKPALAQRWEQETSSDHTFDALLDWCRRPEQGVLLAGTDDFPESLAALPDAPLFLWWRGLLDTLEFPAIAMVGSRNPSPYGREWATQCAADLARAGYCVASGLAIGIDGAAHQGALQQGRTLAVLGSGIDVVYPKRHGKLMQAIAANGLLLSEFPLGTEPRASHFPARNRIVSGLCRAVVVVEAGLPSGSLITAKLAAEQGREVMAVPGMVSNPLSRGCHQLIRDGAVLVESAEQVLQEIEGFQLAPPPQRVLQPGKTARRSARASDQVPGQMSGQAQERASAKTAETALKSAPVPVEHIDFNTTSVDVIAIRSGLSITELLGRLFELEMEGWVSKEPGGYRRLR